MSADGEIWFSAGELSLLGERFVAGLPTTMRGSTRKAQREGWVSREVPCQGGKAGLRTEYQPPAAVQALIHSFLTENPDFFSKSKSRTRADLASASKEIFGDAPKLYTPQMDDVFKRLKDATDTAIRVGQELGFDSPTWIRLIQELIFSGDLTEVGAKRIIEILKQKT